MAVKHHFGIANLAVLDLFSNTTKCCVFLYEFKNPMVAFTNQPKLGYGIFTANDVATIFHLPKEKVRRWLKIYWDLKLLPPSGLQNTWGGRQGKSINFYALVEFYVFYELRAHGVSTTRIVKTHQLLREQFGTPYPFASYRMMTDGRSILFSPDGGESLVNAESGLQYNLKEVIEDFIQKIDFGEKDQVAQRLYPAGKDRSIIVDPQHQFGQPVVKGTNILAGTLYNMYVNGEKTTFIATVYGLKETEVEDAINFYPKAAS